MTPTADRRTGYLRVKIDGRYRKVHQLVLETFVGPCPPGQESRHGDGDPTHNAITNLCWGTKLENAADKRRHGTHENVQRTTCRRAGHLLVSPNLEHWTTGRGGRMCHSCHWGASIAAHERGRGRHLDRDVLAAQMYAFLMQGGPDPRYSPDLRGQAEVPEPAPAVPRTTLDVVRASFERGQEIEASDVLREAARLGVRTSRNAAQTALRRAVERGKAEKVGLGRFRVAG